MTVKTIGDRSRDGLLEIVDTNCPALGKLRVTVRETMGGNCLSRGFPMDKARYLAKGTMYPSTGRKATVVNRFIYHGCEHVTFLVENNI